MIDEYVDIADKQNVTKVEEKSDAQKIQEELEKRITNDLGVNSNNYGNVSSKAAHAEKAKLNAAKPSNLTLAQTSQKCGCGEFEPRCNYSNPDNITNQCLKDLVTDYRQPIVNPLPLEEQTRPNSDQNVELESESSNMDRLLQVYD